ncbi:MAG: hypothetical protein WD824_04585 [Cyclobacteriaceae bacterium]
MSASAITTARRRTSEISGRSSTTLLRTIGSIRIHLKAYRVKLKDTKREFLTKEELTRLEEKQFGIDRLAQVRDVFVFCCYTGLSYLDVEKLTPKGITSANKLIRLGVSGHVLANKVIKF